MYADKKHLQTIFVLILLLAVGFFSSCKKSPTAPEILDTSRAVIWLDSTEISFSATVSGGNPAVQFIEIKNAGPGTLDYTIESDAEWMSVSPPNGTSTGQANKHTVSVNKAGLEAQEAEHSANLFIKCDQAYNNPQQVAVHFKITKGIPPKIWVETQNFTFSAKEGGSNPSPQSLRIKNDGAGTLNYELSTDAPWLSVNPTSGSTQADVKVHQVQADVASMLSGTYHGKITVKDSDAGNNPQSIDVSLNIKKTAPPAILLSTHNLAFSAIQGGADPPTKSFTVRNSGGGSLQYSVGWNATWLFVSPAGGESGGAERSHTVSVNTGGLSTGNYQGTIAVSDAEASNTPQQINVTLNITNPPSNNTISISCSPTAAKTNTIVSFPVHILGNSKAITVFGLDLTFDTNIFEYHSIAKGSLTGGWTAVDGNEVNAGTVRIGGFSGTSNPIPLWSTGTIAIVKLKVISTSSANQQTEIRIQNYIDDIQGMTPTSTSTTFTYLK